MGCGLLGRRLGHSYSPQIHRQLGDYEYTLFEKEPDELEDFLKNGDFSGLNVTVPYKKAVIPYLDELSDIAERLGAVNTIVRRDGRLIGHNTDYFGFETMVRSSGLDVAGKKALVLGSGGASCTACAVLEAMGANTIVISRSGRNNYRNISIHGDATLIVNTTPVGMFPNVGVSPVDLALFSNLEGVLDVIYNPVRTKLLLDAERRGLVTRNGLLMLVAQAKESAEWFTGSDLSDDLIPTIHKTLRRQTENLILVGMPGSGKTTVGSLLARTLRREFVDADTCLVEKAGRSIPDIFAADGESGFRTLETDILSELGMRSGLVIATGGGCVTQPRNYPLLHQNGTIFCLNRDLAKLPTQGRPLSQRTDLADMLRVRQPLYAAFADFQIDNNGNAEAAVAQILEELP